MDIQQLLYINFGLTIITLIGLICVIVYILSNNKSKDNFADEDFKIPDITLPPENFDNTLITDKDGNMNSFSLKNFVEQTKQALKATYDQNKSYIDALNALATQRLMVLESTVLRQGDVVTIGIDNTQNGEWRGKWVNQKGEQILGLKGCGDQQEILRKGVDDGCGARFKLNKFNPS